uniref:Cytochrome P450 CYP86K6 n=1 Tax=Picea glauca TaxID=3330 RepID=A0A0G7ZNT9_PICGL
MEIMFCMALFIAVIISGYFMKLKRNKGYPVNWPVFGMVPSLLWNLSNRYDWATGILSRNNGTFRFKGPWGSDSLFEVVTCSPENLEYILKTEFLNFPKGRYFNSVFFDVFGDGLFTVDGELWKRQRKSVAMVLASRNSRGQNINEIQNLILERLIPVLEDSRMNLSSLDLQDVFLRLSFDSVCYIISGKDAGCLSPGLLEIPFVRAFDEAIESCTYRLIFLPILWKLMKIFNVGFEQKHSKVMGTVRGFASKMVKARRAELENMNEENRVKCADILSTWIRLEAEEGRCASDKSLEDLGLSIILAGRDTAALQLSWLFWLLDQYPKVEEKILSELSHILKDKYGIKPYDVNTVRFSMDDLKLMQYLQAALCESLRLYPAVPVNYREALRDLVLPDGTFVKKGSKVLVLIYATNRMESVWGKDAREFKPERWINQYGICVKESDYKYPVFNAGPRLCLGRDLAYVNMKSVAAHILLRYRVRVDPDHPVKPNFGPTLFMEHGLKVTLQPRRDLSP